MWSALALATFVLTPSVRTAPRADERIDHWQEDVLHLVAEVERLHPAPYFGIAREDFEPAVDALLESLPERTDDQVVVELMRLTALLSKGGRDGHTAVWPTGFRQLPVQVYPFSDGWFVVRAVPGEERLVSARLVRVGEVEVEELARLVDPLLTRDNDTNALAKLPSVMLATELLHALGVSDDPGRARLGLVTSNGDELEVELAGQSAEEYARWNAFPPSDLPADPAVRWLRDEERRFSMEVLGDAKALYVAYREVQSDDGRGTTLADFAQTLTARCEADGIERVVLDLRRNHGGNNGTFGPLLEALRSDERLNRRGRLFVLVGRHTFSAAGNFVTAVQSGTHALLVGEPTGGAPNQYGDARRVTLPHHPDPLVVVSTRYHRFAEPDDPRLTHEPDVPVALSSADYFAGRDPVLAAALTYEE